VLVAFNSTMVKQRAFTKINSVIVGSIPNDPGRDCRCCSRVHGTIPGG
jgi:hypothetical protein